MLNKGYSVWSGVNADLLAEAAVCIFQFTCSADHTAMQTIGHSSIDITAVV